MPQVAVAISAVEDDEHLAERWAAVRRLAGEIESLIGEYHLVTDGRGYEAVASALVEKGWTLTPVSKKARSAARATLAFSAARAEIRRIARLHKVNVRHIHARTTQYDRSINAARNHAQWAVVNLTDANGDKLLSLLDVAAIFGRDHTSIIAACKRYEAQNA